MTWKDLGEQLLLDFASVARPPTASDMIQAGLTIRADARAGIDLRTPKSADELAAMNRARVAAWYARTRTDAAALAKWRERNRRSQTAFHARKRAALAENGAA